MSCDALLSFRQAASLADLKRVWQKHNESERTDTDKREVRWKESRFLEALLTDCSSALAVAVAAHCCSCALTDGSNRKLYCSNCRKFSVAGTTKKQRSSLCQWRNQHELARALCVAPEQPRGTDWTNLFFCLLFRWMAQLPVGQFP
jgi:hypothetical protein